RHARRAGTGGATAAAAAVPARVVVPAIGRVLPVGKRVFPAAVGNFAVDINHGAGPRVAGVVAVVLVPGADAGAERIPGDGGAGQARVDRAGAGGGRDGCGVHAVLLADAAADCGGAGHCASGA